MTFLLGPNRAQDNLEDSYTTEIWLPRWISSTTEKLRHLILATQGFLTLWKDADHDIAILNQAKAEYAKPAIGGKFRPRSLAVYRWFTKQGISAH